jgi:hypothetical protein
MGHIHPQAPNWLSLAHSNFIATCDWMHQVTFTGNFSSSLSDVNNDNSVAGSAVDTDEADCDKDNTGGGANNGGVGNGGSGIGGTRQSGTGDDGNVAGADDDGLPCDTAASEICVDENGSDYGIISANSGYLLYRQEHCMCFARSRIFHSMEIYSIDKEADSGKKIFVRGYFWY